MSTVKSEFLKYWNVVEKNKWLIIVGTIFCMAISFGVSSMLPKVYVASMILEMGRITLPLDRDSDYRQRSIEGPMAAQNILTSDGYLDQVRKELGLEIPIKNILSKLEVKQIVEITRFQRIESPLITLAYKDKSPEITVKFLTSLSNLLINEHTPDYDDCVAMLNERIKNMGVKNVASNELIKNQDDYKKTLKSEKKIIEEDLNDFEKRLENLDFSSTGLTEVLFLKSTLNGMKSQVITINSMDDRANMEIINAERNIADNNSYISNLTNLLVLTRDTNIRSKPVLPDKPIGPQKIKNTIMAGVLAFVVIIFFIFFKAYIKTEE